MGSWPFILIWVAVGAVPAFFIGRRYEARRWRGPRRLQQ